MQSNFQHEDHDSRRKSLRRSSDSCVSMIDGKAYPVYNWSNGGIMIQADDRLFSLNSPIDVTLKFRLTEKIVDVPHRGKIVRKMRDRLAIEFDPVNRDVENKFKQVIDDYVTREFADSQMV